MRLALLDFAGALLHPLGIVKEETRGQGDTGANRHGDNPLLSGSPCSPHSRVTNSRGRGVSPNLRAIVIQLVALLAGGWPARRGGLAKAAPGAVLGRVLRGDAGLLLDAPGEPLLALGDRLGLAGASGLGAAGPRTMGAISVDARICRRQRGRRGPLARQMGSAKKIPGQFPAAAKKEK